MIEDIWSLDIHRLNRYLPAGAGWWHQRARLLMVRALDVTSGGTPEVILCRTTLAANLSQWMRRCGVQVVRTKKEYRFT